VSGVENARGWVFSLKTRNAFSRTFFPRPKTRKPARRCGPPKNHRITFAHCGPIMFFASGRCKRRDGFQTGGREKKSCGLVTRDWTCEESYAFARYFFFRVFKAPDPWVCKPTMDNNIVSDPIAPRPVGRSKRKNETAHVCGINFFFWLLLFQTRNTTKNRDWIAVPNRSSKWALPLGS